MVDDPEVFLLLDHLKRLVDALDDTPPPLLVVGDVLLERVLQCKSEVVPREHAERTCHEVLPGHGDRTTLGGGGACCSIWRSLGGQAGLMSYVGRDPAGMEVQRLLTEQSIGQVLVEVAAASTPFCLRVITENVEHESFEPDRVIRTRVEHAMIEEAADRGIIAQTDRLRESIQRAGALLLYDGGMGFLTREVVGAVAALVREEQTRRARAGETALVVGVMPRGDWSRFCALPAAILVATEKQWLRALADETEPGEARTQELATVAYRKLGHLASSLVITRGPHGSMILDRVNARYLSLPSASPKSSGPDFVGIRGSEAFATVLLLARLRDPGADGLLPAIALASYAGAKQNRVETGTTVGRAALTDSADVLETVGRALPDRPDRHPTLSWGELLTDREQLAREVVTSLGCSVTAASRTYSWKGRASTIVAGLHYSRLLDRVGEALKPGRFVMICGETRSGKSFLIEQLQLFWPGYEFKRDCRPASAVLESDAALEAAIQRAGRDKTCLVLDEIQSAGEPGLCVLLSRVNKADYGGPCPIVCAGHYDKSVPRMDDLRNRAQEGFFVIPPLSAAERAPDIPFLACAFICREFSGQVGFISARAMFQLVAYEYRSSNGLRNLGALAALLGESCKLVPAATRTLTPVELRSQSVCPEWQELRPPETIPLGDYAIAVTCT